MCPDQEILSAWLDGELDAPWDKVIADHVASCDRCRAVYGRLESVHHRLQAEAMPDIESSMQRVRMRVAASAPASPAAIPAWRRRVSLPLPVAALAAVLLALLGVSFTLSILRSNMGTVRITRQPAGGTEYQFTVPMDTLEPLLQKVGGEELTREDVMILPKNVRLLPVGEPRMGKAAEFSRKKTW